MLFTPRRYARPNAPFDHSVLLPTQLKLCVGQRDEGVPGVEANGIEPDSARNATTKPWGWRLAGIEFCC